MDPFTINCIMLISFAGLKSLSTFFTLIGINNGTRYESNPLMSRVIRSKIPLFSMSIILPLLILISFNMLNALFCPQYMIVSLIVFIYSLILATLECLWEFSGYIRKDQSEDKKKEKKDEDTFTLSKKGIEIAEELKKSISQENKEGKDEE